MPKNKQRELHAVFDEAGYTGVVATNCEQEYTRYLRPGDQVTEDGDDREHLRGEGHRARHRLLHQHPHVYTDQNGDEVGWMTFRVLKFKPSQQPRPADDGGGRAPAKPTRIRSPRGHDNGWWWEAIDEGELMIQKCSDCGALRHPPRPMCGECQSSSWGLDRVLRQGHGLQLHRSAPSPDSGLRLPLSGRLIDLEEGTRIVANVVGCEPTTSTSA